MGAIFYSNEDKMEVNSEWTLKEITENLERLKKEYVFYLAFFSYFRDDLKDQNEYKRNIKNQFYKLKIREWQIDMCWEYMNDYLPLYVIKGVVERMDSKKKK